MSRLKEAMQLANNRKMAAVNAEEDEATRIALGTELSDRAVFNGFDIEFDELAATSTAVGEFYTQNTYYHGLFSLFVSAWCDGLLTGLLMASLPPTPSPGDNEVTGEGGNVRECIETSSGWCFTHNQPYATCNGHELH